MTTATLPHIPTFARTERWYYCQCCGHEKPAAGGKHQGGYFTCSDCRKALETMEEKK